MARQEVSSTLPGSFIYVAALGCLKGLHSTVCTLPLTVLLLDFA